MFVVACWSFGLAACSPPGETVRPDPAERGTTLATGPEANLAGTEPAAQPGEMDPADPGHGRTQTPAEGSPPDAASRQDPLLRRALALLSSAPADWSENFAAVVSSGPAMAPVLARAIAGVLDDAVAPPGLQAAIGALEALGDPAAAPTLRQIAAAGGPHAADAALALGALPLEQASLDTLRAVAEDRDRDITLRAAAAATLLRVGHGGAVRDLLRALLLASTPAGAALGEEQGLPDKSRWAMERHFILRALRSSGADTFGLDTDAPWPKLEAGTAAFTTWLDAQIAAPVPAGSGR